MSDKVREQFEAWYAEHHGPNCGQVRGALKSGTGVHAWRCWQASRAAALEEVAVLCEKNSEAIGHDGHFLTTAYSGWHHSGMTYASAIRALAGRGA